MALYSNTDISLLKQLPGDQLTRLELQRGDAGFRILVVVANLGRAVRALHQRWQRVHLKVNRIGFFKSFLLSKALSAFEKTWNLFFWTFLAVASFLVLLQDFEDKRTKTFLLKKENWKRDYDKLFPGFLPLLLFFRRWWRLLPIPVIFCQKYEPHNNNRQIFKKN